MKNKIIKAVAIIVLSFGFLVPCLSITQIVSAPTGNCTLISEETGTFSEIETEEKTTEVTTIEVQETSTKKEILLTTIKETTFSSELKSKEVTVTEMATEKTTTSTTEPQTEVEYTEPPIQVTEPPAQSTTNNYIGTMYITGYTAEEGFPEDSATASGYGVRSGYCALNNSQRKSLGLSYGDKIYVEGLGTYTVMDCGCGWGVVDIWVYSNAEAYAMTGYYDVYIVQ